MEIRIEYDGDRNVGRWLEDCIFHKYGRSSSVSSYDPERKVTVITYSVPPFVERCAAGVITNVSSNE